MDNSWLYDTMLVQLTSCPQNGATPDQVLPGSPRGPLVGSFEAFEKAMYDMAAHEQALRIPWGRSTPSERSGPFGVDQPKLPKPCCNRMPNMHGSSACVPQPVGCSED